jgi:hypothetical protein
MTNNGTTELDVFAKRRRVLVRHIDNVRQYCEKLGEVLIEKGETGLGHLLIANGYCHDQSKFHGIEWLHLNDESQKETPELFKAAHLQHVTTNKHHPEAWEGGVHTMDRLHHAEMVCDWAARSSEFGTDLREYLKTRATKRFDMATQSKAYREVKELMDLLLDPAFK